MPFWKHAILEIISLKNEYKGDDKLLSSLFLIIGHREILILKNQAQMLARNRVRFSIN